jgi:ABC-type polysaccharide/polyol phosphate transport system ATPase subunit
MAIVDFRNVTKSFSLRKKGGALITTHLRDALSGQKRDERHFFHAVRDVSFTIDHAESLALIGTNGAGKSTMLSLIAGLSKPDEGEITINGRVAALLELGSGFHPDLTGEENIRLNAALLGMSRGQAADRMAAIQDFAGLGDFIAQPLRTYSNGMIMRLAFSVAVNVDPDILLVDEVIAVGDEEFQEKCFQRIHDFRKRGKTLILVSHAPAILRQFCDRALWLDRGRVVREGPLEQVLEAYHGKQ